MTGYLDAEATWGAVSSLDGGPRAIEAKGLVKTYGETRALDGLDLTTEAGSILGVLGPNGAGKTTAVRVRRSLPISRAAVLAGRTVSNLTTTHAGGRSMSEEV